MATRRRSWTHRAASLALAAALSSPIAAGAQDQAPLEEGFFELFVPRVSSRLPLVVRIDERGEVLIPLVPVLDHLSIPHRAADGSRTLEWPPETWETVLDLTAHTLRRGDVIDSLPSSEWRLLEGEDHVTPALLGRILQARIEVDWASLVIAVTDNLTFPAQKRLELEAARSRAARRDDPFAELARIPFAARTGGAAVGWGLSLWRGDQALRGSGRATLGLALLGGSLEVGGTALFGDDVSGSVEDGFGRYTRVFPNGPVVGQLHVGHVLSDGPLARRMLGLTLNNRPFTTPQRFGEAVVTPSVPAGWEYEVYQGEHLVGVASADDPSSIRTPLNYGNTPVRVRMLGPAGQEVIEELLYLVPPGRVPAGQWRYGLGAGRCEESGCRSYGFAEAVRGVTSWLSAGAGVDRMEPDSGDVAWRPYATLGFSPRPNMNAEIVAQDASFVRASLALTSMDQGGLSISYADHRPGGPAGDVLRGWSGQFTASGPVGLFGGRWASARFNLRGRETGTADSWQAALALSLRSTHLGIELENGLQNREVATVRAFHVLATRPGALLADLAVSAAAGASSRGGELGELGLSFRPKGSGLVSAQLRLRRGLDPIITVGLSLRSAFGFFQARSSRGASRADFLSADGGLALGSGGAVTVPTQAVGRAGVVAVVYLDEDGDGVRDPGEEPVSGVRVVVDGRRLVTDHRGRASTWELTPYDVVQVAVDSLSIDPGWAPARASVLLRPTPNTFSPVSLGLHRTREVTGLVEQVVPRGRLPLAAVTIEVVEESGRVAASARTFHDGVFYLQRLRPGTYRLRLGETTARALGAAGGVELSFLVGADGADVIELPSLLIPAGG